MVKTSSAGCPSAAPERRLLSETARKDRIVKTPLKVSIAILQLVYSAGRRYGPASGRVRSSERFGVVEGVGSSEMVLDVAIDRQTTLDDLKRKFHDN